MLKNNKGISLITLIVTIIAIIIIAGISFYSADKTPIAASFTNFTEEITNIRTALATYRANCLIEQGDENYGFQSVSLTYAPSNFISFPNESSEVRGYVIDFSVLDYKPKTRGVGTITGEQAIFGEDDVYVYDKNGAVYYLEGFEKDDKVYFNAISYR